MPLQLDNTSAFKTPDVLALRTGNTPIPKVSSKIKKSKAPKK